MMAHDSCSGGAVETIVFDLNGDGLMSSVRYRVPSTIRWIQCGSPEQAAGIVSTNSVASPTMIAGGRAQDLIYAGQYISDQAGSSEEKLIEPGLQPEVAKSMVRGRNLGMTFWRELY